MIVERHYARRMPQVSYAFGLYIDHWLQGVCTYGTGNNYMVIEHPPVPGNPTLELNRLFTEDDCAIPLSAFVAKTLRLLPTPHTILSYADPSKGHVGTIYQALGWIYTGLSEATVIYELEGVEYHARSIADMFGTNKAGLLPPEVSILPGVRKHRYVKLLGKASAPLKWEAQPYPKGTSTHYDTRDTPTQGQLL